MTDSEGKSVFFSFIFSKNVNKKENVKISKLKEKYCAN